MFINITFIYKLLENLLNYLFVVGIGRSDKLIIGCVQKITNVLDLTGNTVNVLLRGNALRCGDLLNLLTVFIGSGLEENIVALQSLVSCDCVRHYDFIAVAYMRLARGVSNSCRDIKLSFTHYISSSVYYFLLIIIVFVFSEHFRHFRRKNSQRKQKNKSQSLLDLETRKPAVPLNL